jgi:hypothetical protein
METEELLTTLLQKEFKRRKISGIAFGTSGSENDFDDNNLDEIYLTTDAWSEMSKFKAEEVYLKRLKCGDCDALIPLSLGIESRTIFEKMNEQPHEKIVQYQVAEGKTRNLVLRYK